MLVSILYPHNMYQERILLLYFNNIESLLLFLIDIKSSDGAVNKTVKQWTLVQTLAGDFFFLAIFKCFIKILNTNNFVQLRIGN